MFVEAYGRFVGDGGKPVGPEIVVEALTETAWHVTVTGAAAAVKYVEARRWPRPGEPWPVELVAAQLLIDIYRFAARVRALRREIVGHDTLDVGGLAELVWLGLGIGALSEALRPGFRPIDAAEGLAASVADAEALLAKQQSARELGTETTKRKAAAWNAEALKIAQQCRASDPSAALEAVRNAVRANFPASLTVIGGRGVPVRVELPGDERLYKAMRGWEAQYRSTDGAEGLAPQRKG